MAKDKVALQIRLDEATYDLLKGIAEDEMRSLNAQMEYFIKKGAEQYLQERQRFFDSIKPEEEPQKQS